MAGENDKDEKIEYVIEGEEHISSNDDDGDEPGDKNKKPVDADEDDDPDEEDKGGAGKVDEDGEDDPDEDDRPTDTADLTDKEREEIRAQRRQQRKDRKDRQRERDAELRRQLQATKETNRQLAERLNLLERKTTGNEMVQLDEAIKQAERAYEYNKDALTKAQEANNAVAATEAIEKMMAAKTRHEGLTRLKSNVNQSRTSQPTVDPAVSSMTSRFMSANSWFKPESNDPDSRITRELDNSVAADGYDPRTQEYWDELNARIKKYLPHRTRRATVRTSDTDDLPANKRRKSTVPGSGRESGASGSRSGGAFKLSADRVKAMKDAGIWDDEAKRNEAIKRYRDFDKANKKG